MTDASAGAAVYSPRVLSIYDLYVVRFSNTFVWRCPSSTLLDLYNEHVSGNHLDVGVGTGYFLDECRFPTADPRLVLLDLNENSLQTTAQRLARYQPQSVRADVLEPLPLQPPLFDSIGVNYLLHCLPGTMQEKSVVFETLKPHLAPGGTLFGSTILGEGVQHNLLGRRLMATYNQRGIFNNRTDSRDGLEAALADHFQQYEIIIVGCVALFHGRDAIR